jgi:phage shock protein PspC (stress-responsive transcriptional regulator)
MEQEQTTTESGPADARGNTSSALWDRPVEGRVIGGVAAGIGERMRVAPWLIRVLFAIATIANGAGLLVYFVLWLLMPDRSSGRSILDGSSLKLGPVDSPARIAGVVLVIVGAAILLSASSILGRPLLLAILLGAAGVVLINSRD